MDQPAGLRTHISVCLGAAVFGIVSTLGFDEFLDRRDTTAQVDVTRVASQVVVGIGFLGAGMIFRRGSTVRNLTTAASLWVTAAIGLAAGLGDPQVALVGTLALLIALVVLRVPRRWIRSRVQRDQRRLRIVLADAARPDGVLDLVRGLTGVSIESLSRQKEDGRFVVLLHLEARPHVDLDGPPGCGRRARRRPHRRPDLKVADQAGQPKNCSATPW
ncbi:hypothetical protein BH24ACT3_BH24ACT3_03410 [soil metagenome]